MKLRETWAAYEGAWSETDPGKRAAVRRQTLDETFFYSDPSTQTESHSALSQYIEGLQRAIPGLSIVTTAFVEHHDTCLVSWTLQDGSNSAVTSGVTSGEFLSNGLLKKATVFYDPPQGA
jgi:hypothetical protein